MSYDAFVQRTTFSSSQRYITYEVSPEKMEYIEHIAISLGAKPTEDSTSNHHRFAISGHNSDLILSAIEMAWVSIDNYKNNDNKPSSLVIVSGTEDATVLLTSNSNITIIEIVYLLAGIAGITIKNDVMEVTPELYRAITDLIQSQKEG